MKNSGDVNGDGVDDFLMTKPSYIYHTPAIGAISTGLVTIRSGVDASLIRYPALQRVRVYLQSFSLASPYASSNGLELLLLP